MYTVVGIAAKPDHPLAKKLSLELIEWLEKKNCTVYIDSEIGALLTEDLKKRTPAIPAENIVDRSQLSQKAKLIVVLGGDGTLISASRHPADDSLLVVGVNLGTLGFLTEITTEEIWVTLEQVFAGKAPSVRRSLLSVSVTRGGSNIASYFALNDAVITKEAIARIFAIDLSVNGELASTIRGDGVIVSTPSGSTAYSLAAGGSIVHHQVDALLVTPICPHSLTSRPLVLPGTSKIGMRISGGSQIRRLQTGNPTIAGFSKSDPKKQQEINGVYLTIDGQEGLELHHGDEVIVTTSNKSISFVRSPSRSYFQVLGTKLQWGVSSVLQSGATNSGRS